MKLSQIQIGQVFNKLTVLDVLERFKGRETYLRCNCECGATKTIRAASILRGLTTSCGCVGRSSRLSHGGSRTKLYRRWQSMIARCSDTSMNNYHNYGGRGISVCDSWKTFENFKAWAESYGYRPELEIDRINNDGNYTPENCRWVTKKENSRNRRNAVRVETSLGIFRIDEIAQAAGVDTCTVYWHRSNKTESAFIAYVERCLES